MGLLALKAVPLGGFRRRTRLWRTSTDMQSEMSRLLAGYRLPAGKHTGILTHFQTIVKNKRVKKLATEKRNYISHRFHRLTRIFCHEDIRLR